MAEMLILHLHLLFHTIRFHNNYSFLGIFFLFKKKKTKNVKFEANLEIAKTSKELIKKIIIYKNLTDFLSIKHVKQNRLFQMR